MALVCTELSAGSCVSWQEVALSLGADSAPDPADLAPVFSVSAGVVLAAFVLGVLVRSLARLISHAGEH